MLKINVESYEAVAMPMPKQDWAIVRSVYISKTYNREQLNINRVIRDVAIIVIFWILVIVAIWFWRYSRGNAKRRKAIKNYERQRNKPCPECGQTEKDRPVAEQSGNGIPYAICSNCHHTWWINETHDQYLSRIGMVTGTRW